MRMRIEIIALLLVLALIAVMAVLVKRDDPTPNKAEEYVRSSYRSLPEGYKALYITLQQLGYTVRRQTRPYALLPKNGLLIIVDTHTTKVSAFDGRELLNWLHRGNTALVLLEYHPEITDALLGHTKPDAESDDKSDEKPVDITNAKVKKFETWLRFTTNTQTETARAVTPTRFSTEAPSLRVNASVRFPQGELLPAELAAKVGGAVPLYRDPHGVVAAYSAVGDGGVIWCCSPWSFSNDGLAEGHNLEFVLALANLHPHAPVLFDEYHNGIGADVSIWTLAPLLTKWGILHLVAALILLGITIAWRFGPPRLPLEERFTRTRAEYLTSMAGLLQRVEATHVVRNRLSVLFRRQVSRRLALPPNAEYYQFTVANARIGAVNQPLLERIITQLGILEQQPRPDQQVLLRLANDIQRLLYKR